MLYTQTSGRAFVRCSDPKVPIWNKAACFLVIGPVLSCCFPFFCCSHLSVRVTLPLNKVQSDCCMSKSELPSLSCVCSLPAKWLITLYEQQKNCWNMTNKLFASGMDLGLLTDPLLWNTFPLAIRSPPLASEKPEACSARFGWYPPWK